MGVERCGVCRHMILLIVVMYWMVGEESLRTGGFRVEAVFKAGYTVLVLKYVNTSNCSGTAVHLLEVVPASSTEDVEDKLWLLLILICTTLSLSICARR